MKIEIDRRYDLHLYNGPHCVESVYDQLDVPEVVVLAPGRTSQDTWFLGYVDASFRPIEEGA